MNYEILSLALLYTSIVVLTLCVGTMFLFIDSRTNELRDRVIHVLISASFFALLLSFTIRFTLDFMEYLP